MAKMLYLLFDWEYPLVMMAGAILVLFGFIGFAFNQNRNVGPIMSRRNEGEREMTMKALVIFTAVCFSTSA
jgi:hypothetical protein